MPPRVRTLLAKRVDVNRLAADGSTALHWAAQRNDLALVDQLLRAGASAKASTRYNVPPLYFAALNGNARDDRPPARPQGPTRTPPPTKGRRC